MHFLSHGHIIQEFILQNTISRYKVSIWPMWACRTSRHPIKTRTQCTTVNSTWQGDTRGICVLHTERMAGKDKTARVMIQSEHLPSVHSTANFGLLCSPSQLRTPPMDISRCSSSRRRSALGGYVHASVPFHKSTCRLKNTHCAAECASSLCCMSKAQLPAEPLCPVNILLAAVYYCIAPPCSV